MEHRTIAANLFCASKNLGIPMWLCGKKKKKKKSRAGDAVDVGSIPGLEKFPGGANGNPPQHSCLENLMDRGAWWATVHGLARSQT